MRRAILIVSLLTAAVVAAIVAYQVTRDRDYRALLTQGDAALRADQTFPAIEAYSGAVALRPDAMLPRLRRGEAFRRRGDIDAAVRDFREAAALDLAATRPREELGDGLYQLQRYSAAIDAYQSALALDDKLTRVESKLAITRYRAGDLQNTISLLTRVVGGPESTAEMQYLLGLALRDAGRAADAQRAFEKAVSMSPGLIAAREELADLYGTERRRSDALEQLQVLAGLDRTHVERQIVLALAQAKAGHIEPAVVTLGTAIERTPDDPRVYQALGQVWLQDAEAKNDRLSLNKAIEALERATIATIAPSDTMTLFGRALLRDGQLDRAEQVLQSATTRFPVDSSAFLYYAEAAERLNHLDAARQALIDLAALDGDGEEGPAAQRALRIATLSMRLDDPVAAARWLQKAIDEGADPDRAELLSLTRRLKRPRAEVSDR
jgi:tetratricopeptide (TPR) repeat protein